jgi:hypothetical protein
MSIAALAAVGFICWQAGLVEPALLWAHGHLGEHEPAPEPATPTTLPTSYEVEPHSLEAIPPGTAVDELPPKGYSHAIIEIHGKLAEGDVNKIRPVLLENQERFHIVLAVEVQPADATDGGAYELKHVAAGVGATIDEHRVIVSTQEKPNPITRFGIFAVLQCAGEEKHVKDVRVVCRSPQLAILDVPLVYREKGEHYPGWRRYAILVEPKSGRVDTLYWFQKKETDDQRALISDLYWIACNHVEHARLHVDAKHFSLSIPTEKSIALAAFPPGDHQMAVPDRHRAILAASAFTPETAAEIDGVLRGLLPRLRAPQAAAGP